MIGKNRFQLWQRMGLFFLIFPILLLYSGCGSPSEGDLPSQSYVPTPALVKLPKEVEKARDVALTYIDFKYDMALPMSDADWRVEYDFPVDMAGTSAFRLTTDSCNVTISNPLMGFGSTIYHVSLDDAEADFHWEGDVDCQGQVLQSWSSVDDRTANIINIVQMADLHKTIGIEVCKVDCASYTPLYTISNPALISTLVNALDTDLPLRPHISCPTTYQLRFIFADHQQYDFGYTCQMMTPTYLRGSQDFWMGQDIIAPDAFNDLMLPLIAPGQLNGMTGL